MLQYTRLANTWPWQKEWISFTFWVPGITSLVLIYFLKGTIGNHAYWLLGLSIWGLIFAALYAYVANKVINKKIALQKLGLQPFDGLISFGKVQSPAAIAVSNKNLYLSAIIGKEIIFNIEKIKLVTIDQLLPGKKLVFKIAFHLTMEDDYQIAFAVNQTLAKELKKALDLTS